MALSEVAARIANATVDGMRSAAASLVVLLLCCAQTEESDAARACIADYPSAQPFDVGDVEVASPPPGSSLPEPAPPSAADIASECARSGGTGCDAAAFISRDAASCIATSSGFGPGLERWRIALAYGHGQERVVWNVMNKTADDGVNGYVGQVLAIDATDGGLYDLIPYRATP